MFKRPERNCRSAKNDVGRGIVYPLDSSRYVGWEMLRREGVDMVGSEVVEPSNMQLVRNGVFGIGLMYLSCGDVVTLDLGYIKAGLIGSLNWGLD